MDRDAKAGWWEEGQTAEQGSVYQQDVSWESSGMAVIACELGLETRSSKGIWDQIVEANTSGLGS